MKLTVITCKLCGEGLGVRPHLDTVDHEKDYKSNNLDYSEAAQAELEINKEQADAFCLPCLHTVMMTYTQISKTQQSCKPPRLDLGGVDGLLSHMAVGAVAKESFRRELRDWLLDPDWKDRYPGIDDSEMYDL